MKEPQGDDHYVVRYAEDRNEVRAESLEDALEMRKNLMINGHHDALIYAFRLVDVWTES